MIGLEDGKNHRRVIKSQPFHNRTLQDFFTGIFKEELGSVLKLLILPHPPESGGNRTAQSPPC
jgi:hypothetical protein